MEECLNSRKNKLWRRIGCASLLIMGALLIIIGLCSLCNQLEDQFSSLMCIVLAFGGFVLCGFAFFLYAEQSREYSVSSEGITIRYLRKWEVWYPWASVDNIAICGVNHAAKDWTVYDIVIRIVIGTEKNGPFSNNQKFTLSGHERWRSFEYGLFHFQKIVIIDYSQERLKKLYELNMKPIIDCRTKRAKKGHDVFP